MHPAIREWLPDALARARAAWPGLDIPEAAFLQYLGERLPENLEEEHQRSSWRVDELYLCCGCVLQIDPAPTLFDAHYLPAVERALRALSLAPALLDEARQTLAAQLLAGDAAAPPLLAKYAGWGGLGSWLRVVAARTGRRLLERERKLVPYGDERIADELLTGPRDDPEIAHLRRLYQPAFRAALKSAMASLSPRQLNLLRHRFIDGLNLAAIGAIYRVHESSVCRWVQELRDVLLARTQAELQRELAVDSRECESIVKLVQSQLDLTMSTILGDATGRDA